MFIGVISGKIPALGTSTVTPSTFSKGLEPTQELTDIAEKQNATVVITVPPVAFVFYR